MKHIEYSDAERFLENAETVSLEESGEDMTVAELVKPRAATDSAVSTAYSTIRIDNLIQHCSCIICLELPRVGKSVFQCGNGHICCSGKSYLFRDNLN